MKWTLVMTLPALLAATLTTSCSSPDAACEPISEDVVLAIMHGFERGDGVIVGDAAGIRDGDWLQVAAAVEDQYGNDPVVGVWRVRQPANDATAIGPIAAADPVAARFSHWPSNIGSGGNAESCVDS